MKFYTLSDATFYARINIFKPFMVNIMSIFEEYGAFKCARVSNLTSKKKGYWYPLPS